MRPLALTSSAICNSVDPTPLRRPYIHLAAPQAAVDFRCRFRVQDGRQEDGTALRTRAAPADAAFVATRLRGAGIAELSRWSRSHHPAHAHASTYLGHRKPALTYWYLEAVPDLMRGIAARCEAHLLGGAP